MPDRYKDPKDALDLIQRAHDIVYTIECRIEAAFSLIAKLSEAAIREEDLRKADKLLLDIYKFSVQLQIILIEQHQLAKVISDDYGENFFAELVERTDKVYHLCQYLSKMHDIKAHRDIFTTNNIIIFLTSIIVYDAIVTFEGTDVWIFNIRVDTLFVALILIYIIFIHQRPPKAGTESNDQLSISP
jgi:hypothetical protein